MELVKGRHIILKRDKLSYDTNILGKWENYRIDTYQGTVLKEAVERCKILLKEGKSLESEVVSLKQQLTLVHTSQEAVTVDLWSMPLKEEYVEVPSAEIKAVELLKVIEEKKQEEALPEVTEFIDTIKDEVMEPIDELLDSGDRKYVVHAYINRSTGKQMYLTSFDDTNKWSISVVPYTFTKGRAEKIIKRANREIEIYRQDSKLNRRYPKELKFEIIEYRDPYSEYNMTYDEIVARANQIKEENKRKKQ